MITSRCIRGVANHNRKQIWLQSQTSQYRKISSSTLQAQSFRPDNRQSLHSFHLQSWPRMRSGHRNPHKTSFRYASTEVRSTPLPDSEPDAFLTPSPNANAQYDGLGPDPYHTDLGFGSDQPVEEYIGYLKEMGLDYGWGPSAFMESLIEHLHIYGGLPWGASIIASIILIRGALLKYYMDASDTSARIAAIRSVIAPIDERIKQARATQDSSAIMIASSKKQEIFQAAGIRFIKMFKPMICQIPLGFASFRLIRGMSALPVPGMDAGGFLWFPDLTVPDPLFVLPLTAAACFYYTFKLGGETGGSRSQLNPATIKVLGIGLPVFTGVVSSFWPAGLQLVITMGGFFALSQAWIFRQRWFRRLMNMQPFPPDAPVKPETYQGTINKGEAGTKERKSMVQTMRDAYQDVVKQGKEIAAKKNETTSKRTGAELKKAQAYEEKIRRQEAQRRFEASQEREAREEERRQRGRLR